MFIFWIVTFIFDSIVKFNVLDGIVKFFFDGIVTFFFDGIVTFILVFNN